MKKRSTLAQPPTLIRSIGTRNQKTTRPTLSVGERMAKARAAKADKKRNPPVADAKTTDYVPGKATPAYSGVPEAKVVKGPHGEPVMLGERGATYYINRNGNKTYLSSNQ